MSVIEKAVHATFVDGNDSQLEVRHRFMNCHNTLHLSTGKVPSELRM